MQLTKYRQRGFSMVEMMIGLAIMGLIAASTVQIMARANNQTTGRATADSLASFQQVAAQYFIANRANIETAMGGDATQQGTYCLINVVSLGVGTTAASNATYTCAWDATQLSAQGLWPTGLALNADSNHRYVAIARQIVVGGTPTGADEMLIVLAPLDGSGNVLTSGSVTFAGNPNATTDQLQAAMAALGGSGGFIPPGQDAGPCQYNGTTKQACGNGWSVNLANFLN